MKWKKQESWTELQLKVEKQNFSVKVKILVAQQNIS